MKMLLSNFQGQFQVGQDRSEGSYEDGDELPACEACCMSAV